MLEVFAVLALVYLLLSLLATTINELIAGFFSTRGKNMERAIKAMLAEGKDQNGIWMKFQEHYLYKQLHTTQLRKKRKPSYLTPNQFSRIIMSILQRDRYKQQDPLDIIEGYFADANGSNLKSNLLSLYGEGIDEVDAQNENKSQFGVYSINQKRAAFKKKLEEWFTETMDRAAGWYKRDVQTSLIIIGFLIAFVSDADTFNMYRNLSKDTKSRKELIAVIDDIADDETASLDSIVDKSLAKLLVDDQLKAARNVLGFRDCSCYFQNLNQEAPPKNTTQKNPCFDLISPLTIEFYSKIFGWLITALAISLGAPFWFDLLKRIIKIRNAGNSPEEESDKQKNQNGTSKIIIQNNTEEIIG